MMPMWFKTSELFKQQGNSSFFFFSVETNNPSRVSTQCSTGDHESPPTLVLTTKKAQMDFY